MTDVKILVTGAGGILGAAVVSELVNHDASVRGLGRSFRPTGFQGDWVQVDLLSGKGLGDAFADVRSVIHCASNPQRPRDELQILDHLIDACRPRGTHLVFISIAGIEDAASSSAYFRAKRDCESKIAASGCQYTIVRATQFHTFVQFLIERLTLGPILFEPNLTFQPVDPRFVAESLVTHSLNQPKGLIPEIHGPERLNFGTLVTQRQRNRGARKLRLSIPAIGPLAAFKRLRAVGGRSGGLTWFEWLAAGEDVRPVLQNHDGAISSNSRRGNSE